MILLTARRDPDTAMVVSVKTWSVGGATRELCRVRYDTAGPLTVQEAAVLALRLALANLDVRQAVEAPEGDQRPL